MTIMWRQLEFRCKCGLEGTILHVFVSSDGEIAVSGCCAVCGEEFTMTVPMVTAIRNAAILDYKQGENKDNILNFVPRGKPN